MVATPKSSSIQNTWINELANQQVKGKVDAKGLNFGKISVNFRPCSQSFDDWQC